MVCLQSGYTYCNLCLYISIFSFIVIFGHSSDILTRPQKFGPYSTYNLILLKVRQSRKQIMMSSILPKNESWDNFQYITLAMSKKEWKISQIFLAFSEYLNIATIFVATINGKIYSPCAHCTYCEIFF